jgi:hypothetical protein
MPCELSGNSVDSNNTPKVIGVSAIMPPPCKAAGAVSQGSFRSGRAWLRGHARPPARHRGDGDVASSPIRSARGEWLSNRVAQRTRGREGKKQCEAAVRQRPLSLPRGSGCGWLESYLGRCACWSARRIFATPRFTHRVNLASHTARRPSYRAPLPMSTFWGLMASTE